MVEGRTGSLNTVLELVLVAGVLAAAAFMPELLRRLICFIHQTSGGRQR